MMRLDSLLSAAVVSVLLPQTGFGQTLSDSFSFNTTSFVNAVASSGLAHVGETLRSFSGVGLGREPTAHVVTVSGTINLSTDSCTGRAADAVAFPVMTDVGLELLTKIRTGIIS